MGLGNPGKRYELTRHNAGFLALDRLCQHLDGGKINNVKCKSTYALCKHGGLTVLLIKPQTFMNLSGEAVRDMASAFSVPTERIIVVFDDADLAEGRLRIRRNGSAGGHNGIKSIIYQLNSQDFPRVKIGIGRPEQGNGDMIDHVMGTMSTEGLEGVARTPEAVLDLIDNGVDHAMQSFNNSPNCK